jgi:hypothetical protein
LHSQPFTNSHFHFFKTVEAATSQVFLQRPKEMEVRRGKGRTTDYKNIGLEEYKTMISDWPTLLPSVACYPY